jgi:predicted NACHT family NTPase
MIEEINLWFIRNFLKINIKKAIELGWLNEVGVAEENPDEQVYAFFHPSFQEYFAALAIEIACSGSDFF